MKCMDQLSYTEEEKVKLEGIVAQLEMESSTLGEYVTLFTHKQDKISKRALAREHLLKRLVLDRQNLRSKLFKLYGLTQTSSLAEGQRSNQDAGKIMMYVLGWKVE